jgi:hypothetical protein
MELIDSIPFDLDAEALMAAVHVPPESDCAPVLSFLPGLSPPRRAYQKDQQQE